MIWLTGPSGLNKNSPQGLNINSTGDFYQMRDPEIPITLCPRKRICNLARSIIGVRRTVGDNFNVQTGWSVESLPSNPAPLGSIPSRVRNFNFCPGIGCVSFVCVLSCVVFGGGTDIVLSTHSGRPALVYLSSVLVQRLLLPLQASDPRAFGLLVPGGVSPRLEEGK